MEASYVVKGANPSNKCAGSGQAHSENEFIYTGG